MTTAEVVAKTMLDEHSDFLREAVAVVARELMEAEVTTEIGAARGEVSSDRVTHRNGYRPRPWETRVGEIALAVPRKRSGEAYFPSFLEPRRPCEQAIVSVVMEAYVNGVSTRKVDRLVEELGISGMSKDRVSGLCRGLDEGWVRLARFRFPDRQEDGAMGDQRSWKAKDGTVFVEREDGGREIITGPADDRKLFQTERRDEPAPDESGDADDEE